MHVGVHIDLPANRGAVPPDVVSIGVIALVHPRFDVLEQGEGRGDLLRRQVEDGLRVSDGNDDARATQRALLLLILQKQHRRAAKNQLLIRIVVQMTQAAAIRHPWAQTLR